MKFIIRFLLVFSIFVPFRGNGQNTWADSSFSIYVFEGRYNESGREFVKKHDKLTNIKILTGYMIDPKKRNVLDLISVSDHLLRISPHKSDNSVLCINIENKLFDDLRTYEKHTLAFKNAEDEFGKMIDLIRELRPNLKIGIYGIPFRTYYSSQIRWNDDCKLDNVLAMTDIIFPSLYILYPDKEKGIKANDDYFLQNLDTAFDYADRLGKSVIPFVWYIVHSNNRLYGGELLGKNEMKRYIDYIRDYRSYLNGKVDGVVWWESSISSFNKNVRHAAHLEDDVTELDRNVILREYIQHVFSRR